MESVTPFGGWLLGCAVKIDEQCPGFAGHLHRCSQERRHVIAAYLSRSRPFQAFASLNEMGRFLGAASHDDILSAAFATVPVGLRGALGRGGAQPYTRHHYGYLHALMTSRARPSMASLIRQLPGVNPTRLRVARVLPNDLRRPNLIIAIKDDRLARDLATLVGLLEDAGADRSAMIRALANVETLSGLRDWARRWAFRVRLPVHPAPPAEGYTPIESADALKRVAIRHRNCMRNYLANALEGRSAFAIAGDGEAVVHLVRETNQWMLDDVYGAGNSTPNPRLAQLVSRHLADHGITSRVRRPRSDRAWASLRRVAGHFDYEGNWETA